MPDYRSKTSTHGRSMAGARSLWRATGMVEGDFGKPIIAIANSFTQFVPGHVHLHDVGQQVKKVIDDAGGWGVEFNTIAIDDGIAMGHGGMLYSLPSRDLIADSVEYMVNGHCADALVCISNCDKITPGMVMAAMRLNIPTIVVSGGPMEAGKVLGTIAGKNSTRALDLVDVMVDASDDMVSDAQIDALERSACPTCGSCSGMFTANSMNCLTEALGLSLPGNGTLVATHATRWGLFESAGKRIVEMAKSYYERGDESILPRSVAPFEAFENAMTLDIAMGGSTNTVLHLLAIAHEAGVNFTMEDIDRLSRKVPNICKVAPSSQYHIQDVNRAGGILGIMGELERGNLIDTSVKRVDYPTLHEAVSDWDIKGTKAQPAAFEIYKSAPSMGRNLRMGSHNTMYKELDTDREKGCIRSVEYPYNKDGGLAVLFGNIARKGCIVKTAGIDTSLFSFTGNAVIFESQDDAAEGILKGVVKAGDVVVIRYEGPKGGPGMQEMLYPTSYIKSKGLDKKCALITDGRFSGGPSGLSIGHVSPEAASGGELALIRTGDRIEIDISGRKINVLLSDAELKLRQNEEELKGDKAYKPENRDRVISSALKAYAANVSSADLGAIRLI